MPADYRNSNLRAAIEAQESARQAHQMALGYTLLGMPERATHQQQMAAYRYGLARVLIGAVE